MRRHIPGLHSGHQDLVSNLDGIFLVRVESASYRWHSQKPFLASALPHPRARLLRGTFIFRTPLLYGTRTLETQLVSSRFWL